MWRKFDNGDWAGYAGAVRFADGSAPWVRTVKVDGRPGTVVVDREGVLVEVWHSEHLGSKAYVWENQGDPTVWMGVLHEGIGSLEAEWLVGLGFRELLGYL